MFSRINITANLTASEQKAIRQQVIEGKGEISFRGWRLFVSKLDQHVGAFGQQDFEIEAQALVIPEQPVAQKSKSSHQSRRRRMAKPRK